MKLATPSITATFNVCRDTVPKVFPEGSHQASIDSSLQHCLDLINGLEGISQIFARCLLITGARPAELLNLRYMDVDHRGMIFIKGLKGSKDRIVLCPPALELIPSRIDDPGSLLFRRFTYAKFYRSCARLHQSRPKNLYHHVPLARMFRSAFARGNLAFSASNLQLVSETMGHKSKTSTLFYLKKGGQ